MVKFKDTQFYVKNLKRKRKKNKKFLTFRSGDLNPRFSVIFPAQDLNFMESEEPEIKSKQATKRDRTLVIVAKSGVPYIGILDMVVGINFNLQQCDC